MNIVHWINYDSRDCVNHYCKSIIHWINHNSTVGSIMMVDWIDPICTLMIATNL